MAIPPRTHFNASQGLPKPMNGASSSGNCATRIPEQDYARLQRDPAEGVYRSVFKVHVGRRR